MVDCGSFVVSVESSSPRGWGTSRSCVLSFRSARFVGSTRDDRTCSFSWSLRKLSERMVLWAALSVGVGAMVVVADKDKHLDPPSFLGSLGWEGCVPTAHAPAQRATASRLGHRQVCDSYKVAKMQICNKSMRNGCWNSHRARSAVCVCPAQESNTRAASITSSQRSRALLRSTDGKSSSTTPLFTKFIQKRPEIVRSLCGLALVPLSSDKMRWACGKDGIDRQ